MRTALILAGLLFSLSALPQEIYRWVDRDGIVHYSDREAPGSKRVELQGLNTYEAETPATGGDSEPRSRQPAAAYRGLEIASPTLDESFFGAGTVVSARADLRGDLFPGHSPVFFLDGNRVLTSENFTAELTGLARGTHFLKAAVLDETGALLIASPQITFHVRLPSVLSPQSSQSPQSPLSPRAQPPPPGN